MNITSENTIGQYILQQQQATLPGRHLQWLERHRQLNIDALSRDGFPSQRDEDWRYTNVKTITSSAFQTAVDDQINEGALTGLFTEGLDSYRVVLINGQLLSSYGLKPPSEKELILMPLAEALEPYAQLIREYFEENDGSRLAADGFTALNHAWSSEGVFIKVEAGIHLDKPIELIMVGYGDDTINQPRNLIVIGEGAQVTILERSVNLEHGASLTNAHTRISLADDAQVDYYIMQELNERSSHIGSTKVNQMRDSRFSIHTLTLGGRLVRNTLRVELRQPGAHCDMLGLYSADGRQHIDNHTSVIHAANGCSSHELYKGVLNHRARAVFHGCIRVDAGAQQTDASQTNNNLLLSRDAEVDSKPQLEIYADDVKCSHGATVGQLDPESLFYLRTRGIDEQWARSLLTFAFLNDVLEKIKLPSIRDHIESVLAKQYIADNETSS